MSASITLYGKGAKLELTIAGYENPFARDFHDSNWLECVADIRVGPFSGTSKMSLLTIEFDRFRESLRQILDASGGNAELSTLEEGISCSVDLGLDGNAVLKGFVRYTDGPVIELKFQFECDRSQLEDGVSGIEEALMIFPVKA